MNEKEDPVVVTWKRNIKNNAFLLLNVEVLEILSVVAIYLVLAKNDPQTKTKPLV